MDNGVLYHYKDLLPVTPQTPLFSLGEGNTPLVRAKRLEAEIGCKELYFKLEGCNPTGSFKDRGMVVAIAKALESGSRSVMCASTGNTSASAAAYAAYCGLESIIMVPRGNIALGKLAQAIVYGAKIVTVSGNFDQALEIVRTLTAKHPVTLVNSVNPHRLQGQKTAAFEVVDVLDDAPDYLIIPVGNAGNISAWWRGFCELGGAKPVMLGFQAKGAAPFVSGAPISEPETIATAIRIGNPASWNTAVAAQRESGGLFVAVSDEEILSAYGRLSREAGVFCEPASAAPVAGLLRLAREKRSFAGQTIVAVLTGHGLKDPQSAIDAAPEIGAPVENHAAALEAALR